MRPNRINKPRRVIHDISELPVICDCAEAGLLLRRNPEVIARMAKEGVLKGAKQGQSWFFPMSLTLGERCGILQQGDTR